jgi:hypothetical protein
MKFILPEIHFIRAAQPILSWRIKCLEGIAEQRRWMACFGARPTVMADVWTRIDPVNTMPKGAEPKHLLWMFYFLKLYNQEELNAANVGGVDEKTFRKWSWLFVEATSYLEYPVVSSLMLSLTGNHFDIKLSHDLSNRHSDIMGEEGKGEQGNCDC